MENEKGFLFNKHVVDGFSCSCNFCGSFEVDLELEGTGTLGDVALKIGCRKCKSDETFED